MAAQQEPEQQQEQALEQKQDKEQEPVSAEPVAETVQPSAVVEKAPVGIVEKTPVVAAPVEQPRTRSEAPDKLAIDSDGVPVAWILQVASVSSADKAEQLRQRLLSMQQKAYVKKVDRGGKDLYRVYIGPKFERAKLEKIQSDVDAEFGVKSMIARYIP
jgi:DedD protein